MTARLPVVGQDGGTWGTLLNEFLAVGHNSDGTTIGGGGSGSLPDGWYDLTGTLTHGGTDNTAALQALINSIPSTSTAKSGAVFMWPVGNFTFNSNVAWGGKAIRNIGAGSTSYSAANVRTAISAGADSFTLFECDGGSGEQLQCASFENLHFDNNSRTGVTALKLQRLLRCRVTNCTFHQFSTGIELNENAVDCAWHRFMGNTYRACTTGVHSTSSNHISMFGDDFVNCTTGLSLAGTTNQWAIFGCDFNMVSTTTGIAIAGYANSVIGCRIEMNNGTTGCVGVNITASASGSTHGAANHISALTMAGGDTGTSTNGGISLDANTTDNWINYAQQQGFNGSTGYVLNDLGKRNRINGGGYTDALADRPSGVKVTAGVINIDPSTHIVTISDGTAWKTIGTAT